MRLQQHSFDPLTVASSLWRRAASGSEGLLLLNNREVETRCPEGGLTLFSLQFGDKVFELRGLDEVHEFSRDQVERKEPDPLWESAHGICSHMETDHWDTFSSFLQWREHESSSNSNLCMPWVDKSGFVLALGVPKPGFVWVPFLEECPTPNDVRKSMIKILRVIRDE